MNPVPVAWITREMVALWGQLVLVRSVRRPLCSVARQEMAQAAMWVVGCGAAAAVLLLACLLEGW